MKWRAGVVMALCAALAGGAVAARTPLVPPGLGTAEARPESLIVFSDLIRMGARITLGASDDLAAKVDRVRILRLQVGFMTDKAAGDVPVRLRCRVRFIDPSGNPSAPVRDEICHEGNLAQTAGKWTLTTPDLRFRPQLQDANGTSGVEVTVTDEISGISKVMMPTYDWEGGR